MAVKPNSLLDHLRTNPVFLRMEAKYNSELALLLPPALSHCPVQNSFARLDSIQPSDGAKIPGLPSPSSFPSIRSTPSDPTELSDLMRGPVFSTPSGQARPIVSEPGSHELNSDLQSERLYSSPSRDQKGVSLPSNHHSPLALLLPPALPLRPLPNPPLASDFPRSSDGARTPASPSSPLFSPVRPSPLGQTRSVTLINSSNQWSSDLKLEEFDSSPMGDAMEEPDSSLALDDVDEVDPLLESQESSEGGLMWFIKRIRSIFCCCCFSDERVAMNARDVEVLSVSSQGEHMAEGYLPVAMNLLDAEIPSAQASEGFLQSLIDRIYCFFCCYSPFNDFNEFVDPLLPQPYAEQDNGGNHHHPIQRLPLTPLSFSPVESSRVSPEKSSGLKTVENPYHSITPPPFTLRSLSPVRRLLSPVPTLQQLNPPVSQKESSGLHTAESPFIEIEMDEEFTLPEPVNISFLNTNEMKFYPQPVSSDQPAPLRSDPSAVAPLVAHDVDRGFSSNFSSALLTSSSVSSDTSSVLASDLEPGVSSNFSSELLTSSSVSCATSSVFASDLEPGVSSNFSSELLTSSSVSCATSSVFASDLEPGVSSNFSSELLTSSSVSCATSSVFASDLEPGVSSDSFIALLTPRSVSSTTSSVVVSDLEPGVSSDSFSAPLPLHSVSSSSQSRDQAKSPIEAPRVKTDPVVDGLLNSIKKDLRSHVLGSLQKDGSPLLHVIEEGDIKKLRTVLNYLGPRNIENLTVYVVYGMKRASSEVCDVLLSFITQFSPSKQMEIILLALNSSKEDPLLVPVYNRLSTVIQKNTIKNDIAFDLIQEAFESESLDLFSKTLNAYGESLDEAGRRKIHHEVRNNEAMHDLVCFKFPGVMTAVAKEEAARLMEEEKNLAKEERKDDIDDQIDEALQRQGHTGDVTASLLFGVDQFCGRFEMYDSDAREDLHRSMHL